MTDQYKATTYEQWERQERRARLHALDDQDAPCLLELRDRIETLETYIALIEPLTARIQAATGSVLHLGNETAKLGHRVEALEAAQRLRTFTAEEVASVVVPTVKESLTDPAGSLVDRVADAIGAADDEGLTNMTWSNHSRAAILEVAAWMREQGIGASGWAMRLESEAN
jgi:hypothetical protein